MSHVFEQLAQRVAATKLFDDVQATQHALHCGARQVGGQAAYVIAADENNTLYVSLETPDRWLSQSIEADLMHQGDKLEDLLEEELVDQGFTQPALPIKHYRDENKVFIFRSPLRWQVEQLEDAAVREQVLAALLAYEACFSQLGDLKGETW